MLKFSIKILLQLLLFAIMLFCLIWHNRVIYGISQGKGQLNIVLNAQPMEEVINDVTFPDSLKCKLKLINEIKIILPFIISITSPFYGQFQHANRIHLKQKTGHFLF